MTREIDDLDFNELRSKILTLLGTGVGSYGYGQEIKSFPVFEGNIITVAQWEGLRYDLINLLVHQNGVTPQIIEIVKGNDISESDPVLEYNELAELAKSNRFDLAVSQSAVSTVATKTLLTRWNTYSYATVRLVFSSPDEARYFFNSGGKIQFTSSRTGGSSTAQNGAWTNILNSVGTVTFGANTGDVNFYSLTNNYQVLLQQALSTPYSANVYRIQVLCNAANNLQGTATSVTFEISWTDNYTEALTSFPVAPDDQVDGTLSLNVVEIKASGNLQPLGNFSIVSPAYEISEISGGYNEPPPPPPPPPPAAPPAPPPPSPPPAVVYNEQILLPSSVPQDGEYELEVRGGAPFTSASFEWRTESGELTSSGTVSLDGDGNWTSGVVRAFIVPGTYTITIRFSYTGNIRSATGTVVATAPTYVENVIVPVSVSDISPSFPVIITGGIPGTGFFTSIFNDFGGGIQSPVLNYLDSSGNFVRTFPVGVVPKGTYNWKFVFSGTGNIVYKRTTLL